MMTTTKGNSRIRAAIFDIDGTLADSVSLIIAAFRKAIEPLAGRPLSDKAIISTFGPDEEGSVRSILPADYKKWTALFLEQYKALHGMCPQRNHAAPGDFVLSPVRKGTATPLSERITT